MNDCPRHYTQKKAAYRSVSPGLTKTRQRKLAGFRLLSALYSCRMRRERLILPTKARKFNILQRWRRPDKRSASGIFAVAISFKPASVSFCFWCTG